MEPLRIEISIEAPFDLVWRAWTEPDRITSWFAPEANVEAKPGGAFELFFGPADYSQECTRGCVFTAVEPMRRLGFTWKGPSQFADLMNDIEPLTSVYVTFHEGNGVTRVVVVHNGWGDGEEWTEAREWHRRAWKGVLVSLRSTLESREGKPCCKPTGETK